MNEVIDKIECKICGREFGNNNLLSVHILRYEKISIKHYYDKLDR